jgi:hypothetical protein
MVQNYTSRLLEVLLPILRIRSPTDREAEMRAYCAAALKGLGFKIYIDSVGNIEAQRGKATKYPLLNAHMDTVPFVGGDMELWRANARYADLLWSGPSPVKPLEGSINDEFEAVTMNDPPHTIYADTAYIWQKNGYLGNDDKFGIAYILLLAELLPNLPLRVLFTVGEERSFGIEFVPKVFYRDVLYCLSLDRRNAHDMITQYAHRHLCSPEFARAVEAASDGWFKEESSPYMADTYDIAGAGINSVNLSVGGYKQHEIEDYGYLPDMMGCLLATKKILERLS